MPKPNQFQRLVCLNYGGGDYAHLAEDENWRAQLPSCGDTLFRFIMLELADERHDPMTRATAVQRMERASEDIQGVLWQIDREI